MTSDPLGRVPRNERRPNTTNQAEDTHVKITNYRKNGEKFQNLLTMRPVLDGDGLYRYVIGVQFELMDDDSLELRRVTTCCWFSNACPVGDAMFIDSGPPVNKKMCHLPRRLLRLDRVVRSLPVKLTLRSRALQARPSARGRCRGFWHLCWMVSTPQPRGGRASERRHRRSVCPLARFGHARFSCDDGHLAPRHDAPMRLHGNRT